MATGERKRNKTENRSEPAAIRSRRFKRPDKRSCETQQSFDDKIEAKFGISVPDYPQVSILEAVCAI